MITFSQIVDHLSETPGNVHFFTNLNTGLCFELVVSCFYTNMHVSLQLHSSWLYELGMIWAHILIAVNNAIVSCISFVISTTSVSTVIPDNLFPVAAKADSRCRLLLQ